MIRFWEYLREYENDRRELLDIVDNVFSSGRLILGSRVAEFERTFASYCGVPFGVGVNSGTDALCLALKALGVGKGDEVITVSNTAVPTVAAVRAAGATPVFVDVEEDTFLMDPCRAEAAITSRTRCILPVHLFGQPADMDALGAIARRANLKVVEDCAQAAGALYKGKRAGSLGDIGAFSFYPTKILGAYGDAGMAITSSAKLADRLRRLRFYGMETEYHSEEEGYNSRLDEVQAAILHHKLKKLDYAVQRRRETAAQYTDGLRSVGDIRFPVIREGRDHQFYAYTIRTDHRTPLMRFLLDQGIETKINYPVPVHLMRGYAFLGYQRGDLPVTEALSETTLSLPIYPSLPQESAARVTEAIRAYFRPFGKR